MVLKGIKWGTSCNITRLLEVYYTNTSRNYYKYHDNEYLTIFHCYLQKQRSILDEQHKNILESSYLELNNI